MEDLIKATWKDRAQRRWWLTLLGSALNLLVMAVMVRDIWVGAKQGTWERTFAVLLSVTVLSGGQTLSDHP